MMITYKGEANKPVIELTEDFRAPKEKIFEVWTEPKHLKNWFMVDEGKTVSTTEIDLRVNGHYKIGILPPESNQETLIQGVYQEIITHDFLKYTWHIEMMGPDGETVVTVTFQEKKESQGSSIFLTHGIFQDESIAEFHAEGWKGCIEHLIKYVDL